MAEEFSEEETLEVYPQASGNERVKSCPEATSDNSINIDNRERSIVRANYGRGTGESRCGGCIFFDMSNRMKKCMDTKTDNIGYCWDQEFMCSKENTCDMFEEGGPITSNEQSYEQDESYSEFEENKTAVEEVQMQEQMPTLEQAQQAPPQAQQAMPPQQAPIPQAAPEQAMSPQQQAPIPQEQIQPSYAYGGSLRKAQEQEELVVEEKRSAGLDNNTDIYDANNPKEEGASLKDKFKAWNFKRKINKHNRRLNNQDENFAMYNAPVEQGIAGQIGNWFKSVHRDFTQNWDHNNQKSNYQQFKLTNPFDETRYFDPANPDELKTYETMNMEGYDKFAKNRAELYPELYTNSTMDLEGNITYTGEKLLGDLVETEYMPDATRIVHTDDNKGVKGAYVFDKVVDGKKTYKYLPFDIENPMSVSYEPNSQQSANENMEAKMKCIDAGGEWENGVCTYPEEVTVNPTDQSENNKNAKDLNLDDLEYDDDLQSGGVPTYAYMKSGGSLPKHQVKQAVGLVDDIVNAAGKVNKTNKNISSLVSGVKNLGSNNATTGLYTQPTTTSKYLYDQGNSSGDLYREGENAIENFANFDPTALTLSPMVEPMFNNSLLRHRAGVDMYPERVPGTTSIFEDYSDFSPLSIQSLQEQRNSLASGTSLLGVKPIMGVDFSTKVGSKLMDVRQNLIARMNTTEGRNRIKKNYLGKNASDADVDKFITTFTQVPTIESSASMTNDILENSQGEWFFRGRRDLTSGELPEISMNLNLPTNYLTNIFRHENEHALDFIGQAIRDGGKLNMSPDFVTNNPITEYAAGKFKLGDRLPTFGLNKFTGQYLDFIDPKNHNAFDLEASILNNKLATKDFQPVQSSKGTLGDTQESINYMTQKYKDKVSVNNSGNPKQDATDWKIEVDENSFGTLYSEPVPHVSELQQFMMDKNIIPKGDYSKVTGDMIKNIRKEYGTASGDNVYGYSGYPMRILNTTKDTPGNNKIIANILNKMLTGTALTTAVSELEQKQSGGSLAKFQSQSEYTDQQLQQWLELQNNMIATGGIDPSNIDFTDKSTWPNAKHSVADGTYNTIYDWLPDMSTKEGKSAAYNLHRTAVNKFPEHAGMKGVYWGADEEGGAYPYLNESITEENQRVPTTALKNLYTNLQNQLNLATQNPGKQNSGWIFNEKTREYEINPAVSNASNTYTTDFNENSFLNEGDLQAYINSQFPEGSAERTYLDANPNAFKDVTDWWSKARPHMNMANQSGYAQQNSVWDPFNQEYITKSPFGDNEQYNTIAQGTKGTEEYNTVQSKERAKLYKENFISNYLKENKGSTKKDASAAYDKQQTAISNYDPGQINAPYDIPPNMEFIYNSAPGLVNNPDAKMAMHNNTHGFGTAEGMDLGNPYLNMFGNIFASPKNTLQAAAIPSIWNAATSIPLGFGLNSGNLINAGFARNAIVNTLPNAYEDYQNEDYGSMATNLGFGALELSGMNRMGLNIMPKNYTALSKLNPTFPAMNAKGQSMVNANIAKTYKPFSQVPLTNQIKNRRMFTTPDFSNYTMPSQFAPSLIKQTGGSLYKAQNGAEDVAALYQVNPEQFDYETNMPKEGAISAYGDVWQGGQWIDATVEEQGFNTPDSDQFGMVQNAFSDESGIINRNANYDPDRAYPFSANAINRDMKSAAAESYDVRRRDIDMNTYQPKDGSINKSYGDVFSTEDNMFNDNQFTPQYDQTDNFAFEGDNNTLSRGQLRDVRKSNRRQNRAEKKGYGSYEEMKIGQKQKRKDRRQRWGDTAGARFRNKLNYALDSDIGQAYTKGSKALVKGAGIVNDLFDMSNKNKEQQSLLTSRTADEMYGVTSADALSRGEWDENTGIFQTADKVIARQDGYGKYGTELPRAQYGHTGWGQTNPRMGLKYNSGEHPLSLFVGADRMNCWGGSCRDAGGGKFKRGFYSELSPYKTTKTPQTITPDGEIIDGESYEQMTASGDLGARLRFDQDFYSLPVGGPSGIMLEGSGGAKFGEDGFIPYYGGRAGMQFKAPRGLKLPKFNYASKDRADFMPQSQLDIYADWKNNEGLKFGADARWGILNAGVTYNPSTSDWEYSAGLGAYFKGGGEKKEKTMSIDTDMYYELLAAGAEIEII